MNAFSTDNVTKLQRILARLLGGFPNFWVRPKELNVFQGCAIMMGLAAPIRALGRFLTPQVIGSTPEQPNLCLIPAE